MKLSQLINYPLSLFGLVLLRKSKLHKRLVNRDDMEQDKAYQAIYERVKPFTMVEPERCYALYQSMQYIIRHNIPGDFAECGVWKGGSAMLMALCLSEAGITNRKIWLYDTFEGMTRPGQEDGAFENEEWEKRKKNEDVSDWCYSPFEEVQRNMLSTGYPLENICMIKGKVEDTIPGTMPDSLAMLRLDTDWYASTKHELVHLYPLLSAKGVLLIDDYGAWQGARKATDEYFAQQNLPVYLQRIDWTGRLLIKG
ncbi:MAG: class I SAM-dependent methyltransferase [Bacteroidetes bacterium]|nr:class I SAM-dependent methyltransferase [Bacteroidota bacterium]